MPMPPAICHIHIYDAHNYKHAHTPNNIIIEKKYLLLRERHIFDALFIYPHFLACDASRSSLKFDNLHHLQCISFPCM